MNLRAFHLHCEREARTHSHAIDQHGAGAAHTMLAPDMGAGKP